MTFWDNFTGQTVWPLKMGPMGCLVTSAATNRHYAAFQNSEDLIYTAAEVWNTHFFGIVCSGFYILQIPIDTTRYILWGHFPSMSLWCWWWGFRACGLWHCITGLLISDISKEHNHFLLPRVESRTQLLKMKVVSSFKISGINNPDSVTTQSYWICIFSKLKLSHLIAEFFNVHTHTAVFLILCYKHDMLQKYQKNCWSIAQ